MLGLQSGFAPVTGFGLASVPNLKVVDLHKAYKRLGISVDALQDAFLCVPDPVSGKPSIYECRVLPFGTSASVAAFSPDHNGSAGMRVVVRPLDYVLRGLHCA